MSPADVAGADVAKTGGAGWLAGVALLLLAFLPYIPVLDAGPTWDEDFLTSSPVLEAQDGLLTIWTEPSAIPHEEHYWPLFYSTFWLETQLFGRDFGVYHTTNVLLHACAALLLWRVLRRLRFSAAWLTAAFFAVHPLHVESVAWTIERKDVLSLCFYLTAALFFLRGSESNSRRAVAVGLAAFVLALLCKSIVVTLPFALLIAVWYVRGSLERRTWIAVAPYLVVAIAGGVFDAVYSSGRASFEPTYTLAERVAASGPAIWFYVAQTFVPLNQMPIYPRGGAGAWAWVALLAAFATPVVFYVLRGRLGRGALAAALFFGVSIGPVLGWIEFSFYALFAPVADRFAYLPGIGLLAVGAWLVRSAAERVRARGGGPWAPLLSALPLVVLGTATWNLASKYENLATFSDFAYTRNPDSWASCALRAWQHSADGEYQESERLYRRSLELRPGFADSLIGLGRALAAQERYAEAEQCLREATAAAPNSWGAHQALGRTLFMARELDAALVALRRAVELAPNAPPSLVLLGQLHGARGELAQATTLFQRALAIDPGDAEARRQLDLTQRLMQGRQQPGQQQR